MDFLIPKCIEHILKNKRKNNPNTTKFESSKSQKPLKNTRKINKNQRTTSSHFVTKIKNIYTIFYYFLYHFFIIFRSEF